MRILLIAITILVSSNLFAQETIEKENLLSKMDEFASTSGEIIKFRDYPLSPMKAKYGKSVTGEVREFIKGNEYRYYFILRNATQYGSSSGSVSYDELLELIDAYEALKQAAPVDIANTPSDVYVENKYLTDDHFGVGYYIDEGKQQWFIKLEKYGSGKTFYPKDNETIEDMLYAAKKKIEYMKSLHIQ